MSYKFTCIINGVNCEMEAMQGTTKLSELQIAIQRKSGIPPSRQQIWTDSSNVDTSNTNQTLTQLHVPTNCHLLILDSDPDGAVELLPSPTHNKQADNLQQDAADNDQDIAMKDSSTSDPNTKLDTNESKEEKENKQCDDDEYEFPAFDFPQDSSQIDGTLIPEDEINELLLVLFGAFANPLDMNRWYAQGLGFVEDKDEEHKQHNNDIRFGLLQIHGGPCGVMAPVQAYMLKEMLFDSSLGVILDDGAEMPVLPTNEQREEALIRALITILLKAATDETYITWIVAAERHSRTYYRKIVTKGEEELRQTIKASMPLLQSRIGVISFVLSVIITRSLPVILDEVDDKSQSLILPEFGHCSQELVNLMITGRCVTNIHDGDKALGDPSDPDTFILKGIGPNQEIGFLTTLEAMRLAKVGDHYKCPAVPIWVVGSSSHYTTLFTLNIKVSKISEFDKKSQALRRQFNVFDVEETGIIKSSDLEQLLKNLQSEVKAYQIRQYFNTGDVILWNDFERIWKMLENQDKYGFHCAKCTFWNKMDATMCEVCYAAKADALIIEKPKSQQQLDSQLAQKDKDAEQEQQEKEEKPPTKFTMYLYNGLKATKKDRPQITKLSVWADGELQQFHSESEELQALIRCKFPYAIVEYAGAYMPKIH
mmetsp:Transcript_51560/g.82229  ORF Transcript_51560/g.82229 Transcript_51560/m.82229 type:complete len:653 (+) Transcript_51560:43-2001(+)